MQSLTLLALAIAPLALARTDLAGCTSSASGASLIYYVPGTGELCEFLDCGGGRAPVKTTVPGCAAYSGTATYSPNYLPGYGPNATPTTIANVAAVGGPGPVDVSSLYASVYGAAYPSATAAASSAASAVATSAAAAGGVVAPAGVSSLYASIYASAYPSATNTAMTTMTTAAPVVSSAKLSTTSRAGNVTATAASLVPSQFPGAASVNGVAGGLGFVGFMAAALALA